MRGARRGTTKGEALDGFNRSRKEKNGGGGGVGRCKVGARRSVQRRQRPGHAGHERAGVAAQNRESGTLMCGPHGTVPVGQVKWRSINLN
jgi:hypothetical protein